MAAASAATLIGCSIGLIIFLSAASGQHLEVRTSYNSSGICLSVYVNSMRTLQRLRGCVVIVGNLRLVLMEGARVTNVFNESFPELREVTGFMVVYRVKNLESIGQLFPNLARIRGGQLINNYGLVVHDMPNLKEVGLYSLLKIDRGGVSILGTPHACYVNTVDWNAIAPRSRHMLIYPELTVHCHMVKSCKCGPKGSNYCWNSKRCQKFYQGSVSCHPECLDCTHDDPNACSICRHYTHRGRCVSQCPPETILLPDSQYCITADECKTHSGGFVWNQTCFFDCPTGYEKLDDNGTIICEECYLPSCRKDCGSLMIHSLSGIQQADGCVRINGFLAIHVSSVPGAIDELKKYLKYIETVSDYVYIYSSIAITSLDFLSNLKQIAGRKLKDNTYSLMINDMKNLRELFPPNVIKDLQIDRGKLKILNNPVLCMNKINELEEKFRVKSNETEIPPGLNGYSGDCEDFGLRVEKENETTATVLFLPKNHTNIHYTVLYAKVPAESHMDLVPETCSKSEWFTIHTDKGRVLLTSLNPASTYAVCIETMVYSKIPLQSYLARSPIVHFTMPFVKPEPPFILEIVSVSPNDVHLRWVDHRDYRRHITSYQLYVTLIDIPSKDVLLRDHCNIDLDNYDVKEEYSRHVLVLQPPADYKSCETDCQTLIPSRERISLMEDYFDVCSSLGSDCDENEEGPPKNSSFKNYVRTIALNIPSPARTFRLEGLAPYRDYKIRLRACAKDKCSRSTRAVIRTLRSNKADIPSLTFSSIDENHNIYIKWEAPEETNGPVFMYLVQVLPDAVTTNKTAMDSWCVYSEERSLIVQSQVTKEFQVRVCSSTLGSFSACSEWQRITIPEVSYNLLLLCITFSITMIVVSIGIGIFCKRRNEHNDLVPLVDMTSLHRSESEPPVVQMTDFMPLYSVPFNDALIDN